MPVPVGSTCTDSLSGMHLHCLQLHPTNPVSIHPKHSAVGQPQAPAAERLPKVPSLLAVAAAAASCRRPRPFVARSMVTSGGASASRCADSGQWSVVSVGGG